MHDFSIFRGALLRKGVQPKDHMKENRRIIRDTVFRMREQQEIDSQEPKELFKLSQFKNVAPRLYESPLPAQNVPTHADGEFLTRGKAEQLRAELAEERRAKRAELEAEMEQARSYSNDAVTQRRPSVPRVEDIAPLQPRKSVDFISTNKVKAQVMVPPRNNKPEQMVKHEAYGRVPDYLEDRKAKAMEEEEERKRNAPDPSCPKGMKLMPEEERLSTIEVLNASKEECIRQLGRLPFVVETATMKKRKEAIESKLNEIEKALELFMKPKVYIALNA